MGNIHWRPAIGGIRSQISQLAAEVKETRENGGKMGGNGGLWPTFADFLASADG